MAVDLREESLLAGYLYFGEEECLAEEFIEELERVLTASAGGEFHLTRMDLDEAKWRDVIDTARTAPFLFEPWRAIVVRVPERKPGSDRGADRKAGAEGEAGRGSKYLSAIDQKILKDYFADPPSRTVIVVIRAGRVRRDDAFVRFFQSLPRTAVSVTEMKRLNPPALMRRADEKARALGKTLTEGARKRLFDFLGQDLRLMMNEISKLAVFVGDKKGIEEADVDQATAGQRSYQAYDLDDALAAADFAKGAAVLAELYAEGERSEVIVGRLAGFFRNVLAAQTWLREKSRTKDEIFQGFFPYISKSWGDLYRGKYDNFFGVVEGLDPAGLNALLTKLRELDRTLKTTSSKDAGEKILLETFLREFCLARRKRTIISQDWS
ncbi:MAG: DNA polymerase III subunit delta [Candidatus Aminicenantes bacterium]|nr:MAG: DNA polymerase III subunit delta [Candidatus Aminicenantes bacterium]